MAKRFEAQNIGFSLHDLALPLAIGARDEEVNVNLLGLAWNAIAPGWGTAEFYERRFLSIPRQSGETIDAYFEVWYEGNDTEDTPDPEELPDREALRRALFG